MQTLLTPKTSKALSLDKRATLKTKLHQETRASYRFGITAKIAKNASR
ncbi:hypothetical protein HMPREF0758_2809 [Serratia odorifera DSM 4582]|uniref:Uncharacterized protein n=1 Tax=Serratia odorifera DSM 4582 TaxID=667129 RepID=D4E3Q9_SEROD|nr:hypothetical protein HMPREF0758_2809 [Serratia odorifera DSM 4582]